MANLEFALVDDASFDAIPAPARPGARCQTCDYWERLDGSRDASESTAARELKLSRLLAGTRLAGAYGMLAWRTDAAGDRVAVGWAQFGPISAYPRAGVIRDRYPQLPDSQAPWVITCLQVAAEVSDRDEVASALLGAVCDELDRRGITAVEAYPDTVDDPWLPPAGPESVYRAAGFERIVDDDRYPVERRELVGASGEVGWGDLLSHTKPADEGDEWPLPLPKTRSEDDLFRLPEKRKRPNPFGDD
ncbi:MAG TPA: hypothetical protein VEW45_05240 [Candidatus Dormibacteraeota bacterium]|nr:hypothetical protein [Candidatus Dormibacteraeota bacterium]